MSYILDALRRAEADRERERGQVPGLHTQPLSASEASGPRRWLPWAGGGLLLLAGIGAGSWWASGQHDTASPVPQAASAPLTAAPAPIASAPVAVPPAVSATTPQPASSGSPYLPPAPPPAAVVAAPAPAPVAAAMPAPPPAAAPTPAPAPAAEAPLPRLAELPESIRRDVPRLVISGSVYSEEPSGRFAMINGEVLREGAQLGPDFVLEQIRPRELVLRFRGQRYRQPV
ncbi:general secretion pathway protein B [Pelomonas saccharophila]|uniref:General secretion pathway protein B n=1 Tax=Roseateles saccharophilus TaxID=304 RepID=A0ABU1YRC4_ROSSA|nr:general secretion pathway protein GspB [Roseateles saccharophilus]MDR7271405.1 general secretion pathway protein B [Roseateles saccharophilus]